jgi:hypothetical protein
LLAADTGDAEARTKRLKRFDGAKDVITVGDRQIVVQSLLQE